MARIGTVVNGVIVPDGGATLPEGTRVRFEAASGDGGGDDFDYGPPPPTETYEQHLAILREAYEESLTDGGMEAGEFFRQLSIEQGLPLDPEG